MVGIIAWYEAIFQALCCKWVFDDDAIDAERVEQWAEGSHTDTADWFGADEFGQVTAGQAGEFIEAFAVDGEFIDASSDGGEHSGVIGELGDDATVHVIQPLARRAALSSFVPMLGLVDLSGLPKSLSPLSTGGGFAFSDSVEISV